MASSVSGGPGLQSLLRDNHHEELPSQRSCQANGHEDPSAESHTQTSEGWFKLEQSPDKLTLFCLSKPPFPHVQIEGHISTYFIGLLGKIQ